MLATVSRQNGAYMQQLRHEIWKTVNGKSEESAELLQERLVDTFSLQMYSFSYLLIRLPHTKTTAISLNAKNFLHKNDEA